MAMSGVKLIDRCNEYFKLLKFTTKAHEKKKYFVMKITDDLNKIDVDDDPGFEKDKDIYSVVEALPGNDGRYVVYDYSCKNEAGADKTKILVILWCPQDSPVKMRMLYAASAKCVKDLVGESAICIQCDSVDDFKEKLVEVKKSKIK